MAYAPERADEGSSAEALLAGDDGGDGDYEFVRAALARVELARMVARQGKFSIRSSAQISYASLRG